MQKIDSLTGLRAFAALWVVLLHFRFGEWNTAYGLLGPLLARGFLGVEIFFVLSGFILAYVHSRDFAEGIGAPTVGRFLWLRLARVYPVHLFTLCLLGLVLTPLRHAVLGSAAPVFDGNTPYTFALNLLLLHAWGFVDNVTWNQPSWSISSEWFAYLTFPALAFLTRRFRPLTFMLLMGAMWVGYWALSLRLASCAGFCGGLFTLRLAALFAVGFCLFHLCASVQMGDLASNLAAGTGIALLLVVALRAPYEAAFFPLAAGLLLVGLYKGSFASRFLALPPIVYLGEISYSLYMVHQLAWWVFTAAIRQVPPIRATYDATIGLGSTASLSLELVAALVAAAATFHFVEAPARNAMRRAWRRQMRTSALAS